MATRDQMELTHKQIQHKNLEYCLRTIKNMTNSQFNYRLSKFSNVYSKWYPPLSFPFFTTLINEFNRQHSEYHGSIVIDLLTKPFISQPDVSPFMYLGVPDIWNEYILDKYGVLQKKGDDLMETDTDHKNWLLWYFIKRW